MVQTSSTLEVDRRRREIRKIEIFPTGLVMSKHFREASTGREILMLEIEKVGLRIVGETTSLRGLAYLTAIAQPPTPIYLFAAFCAR